MLDIDRMGETLPWPAEDVCAASVPALEHLVHREHVHSARDCSREQVVACGVAFSIEDVAAKVRLGLP